MNLLKDRRRIRAAACLLAVSMLLAAVFLLPGQTLPGLLYLETGRVLRFGSAVPTEVPDTLPETAPPTESTEPELPVFTQADLEFASVQYFCGYRPDLAALMERPLDWELCSDQPTVLIVHAHATESYAGTPGYRSLDEAENMLSIGDEVARVLEAGGIHVLHDRTLHDYPDYNAAYSGARDTIRKYLAEYPSIRMVLDIHRDASDGTGGQLVTSATVGGQRSAQIMMVVGTDGSGSYHPGWQENLALALKLTARLEQYDPGISRPVSLRSQRFNMDLTAGSLLVEIGAAGNTQGEAVIAANALARAILALAHGTN